MITKVDTQDMEADTKNAEKLKQVEDVDDSAAGEQQAEEDMWQEKEVERATKRDAAAEDAKRAAVAEKDALATLARTKNENRVATQNLRTAEQEKRVATKAEQVAKKAHSVAEKNKRAADKRKDAAELTMG